MNSVFSGLQGAFQGAADATVASVQQGLYKPFGPGNRPVNTEKIKFLPKPSRGRAPPPPFNSTLKPPRGQAPPPPFNNPYSPPPPYTLSHQPAVRSLPPKPPGPPPVENQLWTCDQCGTPNYYASARCTNCDAQRPNMNSGNQFAKQLRNIPNSVANGVPNYGRINRYKANLGGSRIRRRKTKRNLKKSKKSCRKSSRKN
jgi:hypothetical protein